MATEKFNRIPTPTKGLYTATVADSLGPEFTPWCQNVRFRFGQTQRAPGRSKVLQTVAHDIYDFFHYTNASGQAGWGALMIEGQNYYFAPYNPGLQQIGTPVLMPVKRWDYPLNVINTARFSVAGGEDRIFVVNNSSINAIQLQSDGTWTVTDVKSPVAGHPPGPAPAARYVEYFKDRVFLGYIYNWLDHSGANQQSPCRLQWSNRGDYREWFVDATGTPNSGNWLDIFDGKEIEPITGIKVLNDRLVVYRHSSIIEMVATGDDVTPFLPQGRVYGVGLMAPFTLASAGQFHIFFANDFNVYVWDGARLTAIGTPIHNYLRQVLMPTSLTATTSTMFGIMFMGFKEYWLCIPDPVTPKITILIYDYLRDSWTRDTMDCITALYEGILPGATETSGYDRNTPNPYPCLLAGCRKDFFMIDERITGDWLTRPTDGGMDMWVDTPDMYFDQSALVNGTLQRVLVSQDRTQLSGKYSLQVSVNRGADYTGGIYTQTPTPDMVGYEFADFNLTSHVRRYRLRIFAADGAASPTWRALSEVYVPSGEFFRGQTVAPIVAEPTRSLPPAGTEPGEVGVPVGPDEAVPPSI